MFLRRLCTNPSICYLEIWIKYYSNIRRRQRETRRPWRRKSEMCAYVCVRWSLLLLLSSTKARLRQMFPYLYGVCVYYFVVGRFFLHCSHGIFLASFLLSECVYVCAFLVSYVSEVNTKMPIEQRRYIQVCFPFLSYFSRIFYLKCFV